MSGAGSNKAGGRWNTPGRYVAYASGNLSLAMLELLVHVDDAEEFRKLPYVYHTVVFPSEAVAVLQGEDLPDEWDARPESRGSQVAGDEWIESQTSVVLAVPSVITPPRFRYEPEYMNYLINSNHPDIKQAIGLGKVVDLDLDSRLHRDSSGSAH